MTAGVEAILRKGATGSAMLNAAIAPAVDRWVALEDEAAQEDVRTALRDFTRAYAFLGQIVPFSDPDLESLYYYGKYLLAMLPTADTGGAVDVDGAVVLTHLRTDLVAEARNASLSDGSDDPLQGAGEGRGKQHEQPTDSLSALIAALNERFGMNLGEADRIWFEQQEAHLREQDEVKVVALNNDLEQFKVYLTGLLENSVIDRQEQNGMLFQAFFDKPEFRELMETVMSERLYRSLRTA